MWNDEQEAGAALRTLYAEPPPPPVTTLEQVVRRGRRRVRGHRLGVATLVVVMVATLGGGLMWVRSAASGVVDTALPQSWMTGPGPWPEQLAGWTVAYGGCTRTSGGASRTSWAAFPPQQVVEPAFVSGVAEATGGGATLTWSMWASDHGYSEVEVPVDQAKGSVRLEVAAATKAPPAAAADADVGIYGTCAVPMRKVLASGTVMQLYAPDTRSPFAPVQHVRTYLPNGRLYVVSSAGWSRSDIQPVAGDPVGIVRSGRGRLPLDSRQLADVATRMAALN